MALRSKFEYQQILANNPIVRKFLTLISWSEGADYYTTVGGGKVSDLSVHPAQRGFYNASQDSTASGAYQMIIGTWRSLANRLGLNSFSPENQDIAALANLDENGGLTPLLTQGEGGFSAALSAAGKQWAGVANSSLAAKYGQKSKSLSSTMTVWGDLLSGKRPSIIGDNVAATISETVSGLNPFNWFFEPVSKQGDKFQKFIDENKKSPIARERRFQIALVIIVIVIAFAWREF